MRTPDQDRESVARDPQVPRGEPAPAALSRAFTKGLLGLIGFLVTLNLLGLYFELQVVQAAEWVFRRIGIEILLAFVFLNDVIVSPIPVDIVLVLMSRSEYREHWALVSVGFGTASALAGTAGWAIGRWLAATRRGSRMARRIPGETLSALRAYGGWVVAAGALTPLPFSITCWAAGFVRMPPLRVAILSLLRIPRFLIYYLIIVSSL